MDWSDENFVKLYTRDSIEWLSWSFQTRCVWMLMMRKFDRAGVIDLGKRGLPGLALLLQAPLDFVIEAMPELTAPGGPIEERGQLLVARNFIEAQARRQNDRHRQAESRARRRETARLSRHVTEEPNLSHAVTRCHTESQPVTIRVEKSRVEESREDLKKAILSRKRDPVPLKLTEPIPEPEPKADDVGRVIACLNEHTGHAYQAIGWTRKRLLVLLRSYTVAQIVDVIEAKCAEWGADQKMRRYLRPKTLFSYENFENYSGEAKATLLRVGGQSGRGPPRDFEPPPDAWEQPEGFRDTDTNANAK